jgi:hypothetical protein
VIQRRSHGDREPTLFAGSSPKPQAHGVKEKCTDGKTLDPNVNPI